jgi:ankyrin repeat protein
MEIEVLLDLIELILTQKDEFDHFVENLAKKNFVIDEEDLLAVTKMRQFELVRFVLKSGVKPTLSSFRYAAEHDFFELCSLFVEFGSREILSTPELEKELILAIEGNLQEKAINLINLGVNPTTDGNFAIQTASNRGYLVVVRLLLKHGADPTTDDNLAIQMASVGGHAEIVQLLLDKGANSKSDDNYAIRWASTNGHFGVVHLLLDNGADPTSKYNMSIKRASERGHLEVVRLLLNNNSKYKVDPAAGNNYAIKNASGPDKDAIIELLKSRGASL